MLLCNEEEFVSGTKKQLGKERRGGGQYNFNIWLTLLCSGSRHLECCLDEGRGVAHAARGSCNGRGPCSPSSALIWEERGRRNLLEKAIWDAAGPSVGETAHLHVYLLCFWPLLSCSVFTWTLKARHEGTVYFPEIMHSVWTSAWHAYSRLAEITFYTL